MLYILKMILKPETGRCARFLWDYFNLYAPSDELALTCIIESIKIAESKIWNDASRLYFFYEPEMIEDEFIDKLRVKAEGSHIDMTRLVLGEQDMFGNIKYHPKNDAEIINRHDLMIGIKRDPKVHEMFWLGPRNRYDKDYTDLSKTIGERAHEVVQRCLWIF
jgi:hypothetical protein